MTYATMGDAAFAANLNGTSFEAVSGYYGGPNAYHVWPDSDWHRFPGFRLPNWVAGDGGQAEGADAVAKLRALGVPKGSLTAVDMETRRDITYLERFGGQLQADGYKVWVYGSEETVFSNPPLNGYWVASYGITMTEIEELMRHPHVRAVQYKTGPLYDSSVVKPWTEGEMWHG